MRVDILCDTITIIRNSEWSENLDDIGPPDGVSCRPSDILPLASWDLVHFRSPLCHVVPAFEPASRGPFGVDTIFTGIMVSTFLCGITVVQTWNYFSSNSANDGWMLKSFVVILLLLDTVTAGLTVEVVHFYLVENFGNLETLGALPLAGVFEVGFNVVTVFLVELFFAHRVYLLFHRHLVMPAIIVTFSVAGLVAGIFIVVDISHDLTVAALAKPSMKIETALCNSFLALSDLTSTFAMSYAFYTSRGPIKSTNSLLDKLLGFVVARGGLITATQFLTLALYVAQPTKLNWMPVHFMLSKLW
ncbi:hypothetical protein C8R47DRAFT_472277 [Mycena vitilis]|nr:hypothetical protein C8R47DRAFT_472277 [Mycena vitilis]